MTQTIDKTPDATTRSAPSPKSAVSAGAEVKPLFANDMEGIWRIAEALAATGGDMIPKHFSGKPGAVFAAIQKGAELGLPPMGALSHIAVINGRPSLWGDALPALCLKHGHQLHESIEGEGDSAVATCTLRRGDTGQEITRTFSMGDAQKAGLKGKAGPWQQYPKRMLAMRARGFAVRDGAADVMVGLAIAEEQRDMTPMRDITPAKHDTQAASNSIISALPDEPEQEAEEEAQTGEIMDDPAPTDEQRAEAEAAALAEAEENAKALTEE